MSRKIPILARTAGTKYTYTMSADPFYAEYSSAVAFISATIYTLHM